MPFVIFLCQVFTTLVVSEPWMEKHEQHDGNHFFIHLLFSCPLSFPTFSFTFSVDFNPVILSIEIYLWISFFHTSPTFGRWLTSSAPLIFYFICSCLLNILYFLVSLITYASFKQSFWPFFCPCWVLQGLLHISSQIFTLIYNTNGLDIFQQ